MTPPAPRCQAGDRLHGFRIDRVEPLPAMRAAAVLAEHEASGARLLHLAAGDPENLFCVAFRTPPPDSTGLPHILEHTVLCGSKRFPVKDPFVELLKTSLATFLNAMTYPDKTVYPCASMLPKDFFHLAQVYFDAAFHPLITETHFKQEGHHFAFRRPGDTTSPLIIKGIVYNEMRGAYSDLDGTIDRHAATILTPDTPYGRDPGGDPEAIPLLTYEALRQFHATYYHPSNALFFLYGDIPTGEHLAFLAERLAGFSRIEPPAPIGRQARWSAPVDRALPYPVGDEGAAAAKTAVRLDFLTLPATDGLQVLAMHLLDSILLDNAASPLRKALIDSKLGEELTDSGFDDYRLDTRFFVGLKGTKPDAAPAVAALVRDTCRTLSERGLGRERIERALHQLEIASREIPSNYPLRLMDRVYRSWLYGADPLQNLRLDAQMEELRRRVETEPRFLEELLRTQVVENPHCARLTFRPDPDLLRRKDAALEAELARKKNNFSASELDRIAREDAALEAAQSAPNPPEALATLPRLKRADIPEEPRDFTSTLRSVSGRPLLYTDVFANGLSHLALSLDLSGLPEELLDCLPLYTEAFSKMGAGPYDYVVMAEREADATGGLSAGLHASGSVEDPDRLRPQMLVRVRALDRNLEKMFDILSHRLLRCDFTDTARLKDAILQTRASWRSQVIPGGTAFAARRAARSLGPNADLAERFGGATQVRLHDRLAEEFEKERAGLVEKLRRIQSFLLERGRLAASYVGDPGNLPAVETRLAALLGELRDGTPPAAPPPYPPVAAAPREGLAAPADVAFAAQAIRTPGALHRDAPALLLLAIQLSYGYLWEEVRVKGGAYGGHARYNPFGGIFLLSSYRDPAIRATLDTFSRTVRFVTESMDLTPSAVEQAVIGTIKTTEEPIRPGPACQQALLRHLDGNTAEFRRALRRRLLALDGEAIRRAALESLAPALESAPVCVLSSRERLEAANRECPDRPLAIETL